MKHDRMNKTPQANSAYYLHQKSQLIKTGCATVFICDPYDRSFVMLRENANAAFEKAYSDGNADLINRPEKASIDFDLVTDAEPLTTQILQKSGIKALLEGYLGQKIYYDVAFSKFRLVCHDSPVHLGYAPLHYDGSFLPGKSLNVCIPFTGYGGPFPGLNIWPTTFLHTVARGVISDTTFKKFLPRIMTPLEPYVTAGSALVFNEKVYHCRTVDVKSQSRLNLEFRFFPESALSEKNLDLRPFTVDHCP